VSGCGGSLYQPLSENRRRVGIQPEREGYDDLHVIHVRAVAAVQTNTFVDLVVVQGVAFDDRLDCAVHRSGGRAEQFDYFRFRHPYAYRVGRYIQPAPFVYRNNVSFSFHRLQFF
jgi:hypothetical protein